MKKMFLAILTLGFVLSNVPAALAQDDCQTEPGNWIRNPRFDQGLNCWSLIAEKGGVQFDDRDSRLNVRFQTTLDHGSVTASQYLGFLFSGYTYGVSLIAWSDQPGTLVVSVQSASNHGDSVGVSLSLGTVPTSFGIGFGHLASADAALVLHFERCTTDVHVEYVEFTVMDGSAPVSPTTWGGIKAQYQ